MKNNAEIKAKDIDSQAPLHVAAQYKSTEVAQLLMKHRAGIKKRNVINQTPLHYAA